MGARLARQIAAMLVLLFLTSGAGAQSTTECRTVGGVTRCETTPSQQPLDYGATLRSGQDLVPRYVPPTVRPEPTPPKQIMPTATRQIETGNDLMAVCESKDPACLTYIQGTLDGYTVAVEINDIEPRACLPEGVTKGQSLDVIMAEMKRSPENRHWPAAAVVMYALVKAFPCTK